VIADEVSAIESILPTKFFEEYWLSARLPPPHTMESKPAVLVKTDEGSYRRYVVSNQDNKISVFFT
jgi:hypothetical protein